MTRARAPIPLLIDCDTGIDDSLALLYACASPEAEILAVTCLSGNVGAEDVARNTLAVLELAGRTDIEVAIGRTTPLVRPLEITPETHGPQGIGHAELPPPSRSLSERHGADVIVETARARPGEVTLVTLGPLTNLAVALEREPDLPRLLQPLGPHGWLLPCRRQHDPARGVEHPLRSRGGPDRVRRVRRAEGAAAADRARPRRDRAPGLRARPSRRACPQGRQPARQFAGPGTGRGPDADDAQRGVQPDRPLPRRCAAVLHGVPRPLRRLLRRVHPRRAGARDGARPDAWSARRR